MEGVGEGWREEGREEGGLKTASAVAVGSDRPRELEGVARSLPLRTCSAALCWGPQTARSVRSMGARLRSPLPLIPYPPSLPKLPCKEPPVSSQDHGCIERGRSLGGVERGLFIFSFIFFGLYRAHPHYGPFSRALARRAAARRTPAQPFPGLGRLASSRHDGGRQAPRGRLYPPDAMPKVNGKLYQRRRP